MSTVHSHIQTGIADIQFPFVDPEQHNKLLHRQPDLQRPMNPPHLGGAMPGQASMLNLYGGGLQQQQQQFQQQISSQHPQQQPQGAHSNLGIMSSNQGLIANSGGQPAMQQQLQHQNQLQHPQQQRALMQQRGLAAASGIMGNPSAQMQQGMFPPGVNQQMRRISAQPPPHPQGAQMGMGMQIPQQSQSGLPMMPLPHSIAGQLRQGGPNARMLANHGPPQHPDMAHVMAMGRQQQQQQTMVNGMQPGQHPRTSSGAQLVGPPHQIPHQQHQQQQSQHRTPFQQQGPLPPHQSHAPSPTRPPSHHSQSGTPTGNAVNAGTAGQQPPMRPQQTSPESMFMNLQQQQPQNLFPGPGSNQHQAQQPQRPPGAPTFPFLPESSPGGQHHPESSNQLGTVPQNPAAPPQARQQQQQPPFHITPAQLQQQMQQQGGQEPFGHVMIPHNANLSHRMPPSQNTAPLAVPGPSRTEPAPQAGPSRTPRPPSRHPNQPPPRGPPPPGQPHVQPILPATSPHHRRASVGLPTQPPPLTPTAAQQESPPLSVAPSSIPRPPQMQYPNPLGSGQGLIRLLKFSAAMANEKCDRLKYDHWNKVVTEYFSPQALWKLTLWKDNERREAKPFEIGPNVIAMLLLVSCQSGVRSMSFVLDGARERSLALGTSVIECPDAQWIWRFYDGHVITLRGVFACQISAFHNRNATDDQSAYSLKFDSMSFDSNEHDRLINLEAIRGTRALENVQKTPATTTQGSPDNASSSGASANTVKSEENMDRQLEPDPRVVIDHALLPQEPINAFGIPQASMRCLELAESVGQMTDLFHFGWVQKLGPQEALTKMGLMIRQQMGMGTDRAPTMLQGESKQAVSLFGNNSTTSDRPPPGPHPPPPPQPAQQLVPGAAQAGPSHSPQHQPQPPQPASKTGPSTGVSAPSGPASLKRKAQQAPEASGPAGQTDSQPPAKRVTRRKSKAGGGG